MSERIVTRSIPSVRAVLIGSYTRPCGSTLASRESHGVILCFLVGSSCAWRQFEQFSLFILFLILKFF